MVNLTMENQEGFILHKFGESELKVWIRRSMFISMLCRLYVTTLRSSA